MLNIFKNQEEKKEYISSYQNPFKSDKVRKIEFSIENSRWHKETEYKSVVMFDTGATTGYHRMTASSFSELIEQTELFIKSL